MVDTPGDAPPDEKPAHATVPVAGDGKGATTADGETLKLVVPAGAAVAGGTVLTSLRNWNRRRRSRKRERAGGPPASETLDAANHPLRSAAGAPEAVPGEATEPAEGETEPAGLPPSSASGDEPDRVSDAARRPVPDPVAMNAGAGTETPPADAADRPPADDPPAAADRPPADDPPAESVPPAANRDPIAEPPADDLPPESARPGADPIAERRAAARRGGGQKRIDAQHARGKLTARERIERMLDADSFEELAPYVEHRHDGFGLDRDRHAGDGVVTGFGLVDGRRIAIFAQDFTVLGGSFSEVQAMKVGRLIETATSSGLPIVALLDSVGARIQEGVWSLAGFGDLFWRNTQASGVVPQISLMLGPCAGGAVYSPGLTDFVVMTRGNSFMFITGPDVIQTVTGEEVDAETLGGATTHAAGSGVAHFVTDDENGAFALTRRLLGYLPSNNVDDPPALPPDDALIPDTAALDGLIPESAELSYDVRDAIGLIADRDSFLEVQPDFAPNAVVGFARVAGRVAAFVANQPAHLAGVLDIDASDKIARFIRFSDAFNIPIVTLVDCPGFLPGSGQERQGIIRHGAKIVYAYSEATVPKVSVVLRKAYGGAYIVMSSKMIRTDVCLAWPTAEIAVMGPKGAVNILYARRLAALDPAERDAERTRLEDSFQEQFNSPFVAAAAGHIDDVIYPRETRARVTAALDFLKDKQTAAVPKKHGNIPL